MLFILGELNHFIVISHVYCGTYPKITPVAWSDQSDH